MRGGIAERGGVRVGHRIIEINGQSVVAVPHEKIVNLLATSVGEVRILKNKNKRHTDRDPVKSLKALVLGLNIFLQGLYFGTHILFLKASK